MAGRWEVDPESKSKLTTLQSLPPNRTCIDCSAPSPQWASPKFGTFICLTCAGLHRSLGVHISFVRSIAMDSFKPAEVERMTKGGNARWKEFWESKNGGAGTWSYPGKGGDEAAKRKVEGVYGGEVGEEYKERLTCEVEGREFTGMPERPKQQRRTDTASPAPSASSGGGIGNRSQKEMNESFFAKKGAENAYRPEGLKPSEGGKYAGFGSGVSPEGNDGGKGGQPPGLDDIQQDPLAAIGKGWGWFSGQAAKVGKGVYEGGVFAGQKIAEADLAAQARQAAAAASKGIQTGTKGAANTFNNFVEGEGGAAGARGAGGSLRKGVEPEKKDFWDSFGEDKTVEPEKKDFWDSFGAADEPKGSIGTSAMRKGGDGKKGEGWDHW